MQHTLPVGITTFGQTLVKMFVRILSYHLSPSKNESENTLIYRCWISFTVEIVGGKTH